MRLGARREQGQVYRDYRCYGKITGISGLAFILGGLRGVLRVWV